MLVKDNMLAWSRHGHSVAETGRRCVQAGRQAGWVLPACSVVEIAATCVIFVLVLLPPSATVACIAFDVIDDVANMRGRVPATWRGRVQRRSPSWRSSVRLCLVFIHAPVKPVELPRLAKAQSR